MANWKEVTERWLPIVEHMEEHGMDDYAIPEIYRAAEREIAELNGYRNQYHMAEAKVLSRDVLLEQLTEEQLTIDLVTAENTIESLKGELRGERERLLLEMYNNDTISQVQFDHAMKELALLTKETNDED